MWDTPEQGVPERLFSLCCACRAGQRGGAGEEADLQDRHQGFPAVLRSGVPDQAGEQPDRARGRGAEQHHGATCAGLLPRGGSDQEDPCGAPGKEDLVQHLCLDALEAAEPAAP